MFSGNTLVVSSHLRGEIQVAVELASEAGLPAAEVVAELLPYLTSDEIQANLRRVRR